MRPRQFDFHLPRRVYSRRGKYYYVYQKTWYPLGSDLQQAIDQAAQLEREIFGDAWKDGGPVAASLLANKAQKKLLRSRTAKELAARRALMAHLRISMNSCKVRAKKAGIPFELSMHDVEILLAVSKSRCAVTGHEFNFGRYGNTKKRPFVPSIDRIDSSRGYSIDNCRIVCSITNIAMNAWGEHPLKSLILASAIGRGQKEAQTGLDAP